jgi:hypothetical protein
MSPQQGTRRVAEQTRSRLEATQSLAVTPLGCRYELIVDVS